MQIKTYRNEEEDNEATKNFLRKFVDIDSKLTKLDFIIILFFIFMAIIGIITMIKMGQCTLDCAMCPDKAPVTIGWK